MALDPWDILSNPLEWVPISRDVAVRNAGSGRVAVVYRNSGVLGATAFLPDSPFYLSAGPFAYDGLRYFARLGSPSMPAPGRTPARPNPRPKAEAEEEPEELIPLEQDDEAAAQDAVPAAKPPEIRITALEAPQFAPGVETLSIRFAITGDLAQAGAIHLRVSSESKPDVFWLDRKLDAAPKAEGAIPFDGSVDGEQLGGYLNLEQGPYLVQLGLAPKGGAPVFTNKVKLKVELAEVEIQVGDDLEFGQEEKDKPAIAALREDLAKDPGKGRVRLDGATFKLKSEEMNDHTAHRENAAYLGKGPGIPLFVNLWVKGKSGAKVRAPRAVHGTRIVWDVLPDDKPNFEHGLGERKVHAKAKGFLLGVAGHEAETTSPPGWTCHSWLGGMRNDAAYLGDPDRHWKALLDKWNQTEPDQRVWATLTHCRVTAESDADSGILYHNGPIAGDRHWVTAYADLRGTLDVADVGLGAKVGPECRSRTLALLNWKEVRITRSYISGADVPRADFAATEGEFNKAAMSMLPAPGLAHEDIRERWTAETKAKYAEMAPVNDFIRDALDETPGGWAVAFRGYNDYWNRTHPDAGFFGRLWNRIKAFFGAADEDAYQERCEDYAFDWMLIIAKRFPIGENGLTCFKFGTRGIHNHEGDTYTAGVAPAVAGYSTRHKAVLFLFSKQSPTDTVIHEMGHNLFLAHAPGHFHAGKQPAGFQEGAHHKAEICLMSYHPDGNTFCGFCLVKLAGWDTQHVHNDGTVMTLM